MFEEHFSKFRLRAFFSLTSQFFWLEVGTFEEAVKIFSQALKDAAHLSNLPPNTIILEAHLTEEPSFTIEGERTTINYHGTTITKPNLLERCHEFLLENFVVDDDSEETELGVEEICDLANRDWEINFLEEVLIDIRIDLDKIDLLNFNVETEMTRRLQSALDELTLPCQPVPQPSLT